MINEIFRSYLALFLSDKVSNTEKEILANNALFTIEKLLKNSNINLGENIFKKKILFLKEIANIILKRVNINDVILNKLFIEGTLWNELKEEVQECKKSITEENEIDFYKEQLLREKQFFIFKDYIEPIKRYIYKLENKEFKDVKKMHGELRDIIEVLYMELMKEEIIEKSSEMLQVIDYNEPNILLQKMRDFYRKNIYVSSGIKSLDRILGGGFERTRLYLFAGKPGSGKSTLLLNFLYNIGKNILNGFYDRNVFVLYISLENLAIETNQRLLCRHLDIKKYMLEEMIKNEENLDIIKNSFNFFREAEILISYFPPKTFTVGNLFSYIDEICLKKKKRPIALILDYLDLMKSNFSSYELRHQLGEITLSLKTLAVNYQIPVITASQLLKNAYEMTPALSSVKESSEKLEHSDVVALIKRLDNGDNLEVMINENGYNSELVFLKNRSNNIGTLKYAIFYDRFLITEMRKAENEKKNNLENNKNNSSSLLNSKEVIRKSSDEMKSGTKDFVFLSNPFANLNLEEKEKEVSENVEEITFDSIL